MNALALKDMENFESNGYLQNCNFSATLQLFMPRNHASLNVIKKLLRIRKSYCVVCGVVRTHSNGKSRSDHALVLSLEHL